MKIGPGSEAGARPPARHVVWAKGGHAEVRRLEGETIELRTTVPAPPGARLEGTLAAGLEGVEGGEVKVTVKSYGTQKKDDGSFALKGRLIDASRALRDRLSGLVSGLAGFTPPAGSDRV